MFSSHTKHGQASGMSCGKAACCRRRLLLPAPTDVACDISQVTRTTNSKSPRPSFFFLIRARENLAKEESTITVNPNVYPQHAHVDEKDKRISQESRALGLRCGIRSPTYSTAGGGGGDAGLSGPGCGHASTVVSATPIPVAEGGGEGGGGIGRSSSYGGGGLMSLGEANSFQVASLDDRGTVSIWVASEVPRADEGGSQVRERESSSFC